MNKPVELDKVIESMRFGERWLCLKSISHFFTPYKSYKVEYDSFGYIFIKDNEGNPVYVPDHAFEYETVIFTKDDGHCKEPIKLSTLNKTVEIPYYQRTYNSEDKEMTPSKIRETVNRLNGVKPYQDRLVSLRQTSSKKESLELDLAHLLLTSKDVEKLKPGKDCLVTGLRVDPHGSKVVIDFSVGEVEREENEALASALTDLVSKHTEETE